MAKRKFTPYKGQIGEVAQGLDTRLRVFKQQFGLEFLERVRNYTPVRTGHLQSMWDMRQTQTNVVISNKAEYAQYVEEGTDKMAPRRMLARTMEEKDDIFRVALEQTKKRGNKTPE